MDENMNNAQESLHCRVVREFVMDVYGRMPETEEEIDQYLDLISIAKEYAEAVEMKWLMGGKFMKMFGFKTPEELRKQWCMKIEK